MKVFGSVESPECYLGHPWMVPKTKAKPKVEREWMRQVTNSKNE